MEKGLPTDGPFDRHKISSFISSIAENSQAISNEKMIQNPEAEMHQQACACKILQTCFLGSKLVILTL